MTTKVCNYYVTFQCDDQCEFCSIWQKDSLQQIEEKPYDLSLLKRVGVELLNITGGEPLLREDLPEILKKAKELSLTTQLMTNGIIYPEKARLLQGLVDRLFISLDYPLAEEHDRSRGVECFHEVIKGLKLALELRQEPIINFTITRDSVRFAPEMIDLAQKLGVYIYLNPVYDFFGSQGFEPITIDQLKYFARHKNVLANFAVLEFVKSGGNRAIFPRCKARETTITILPDGRRVTPCFYNQGGRQGREDICSSCMRWPYMVPSLTKGLDKYVLLSHYSQYKYRRLSWLR